MELMRAFWIEKNHRREVVVGWWLVFLVGGNHGGNVLFGQNMTKYGTKIAQND